GPDLVGLDMAPGLVEAQKAGHVAVRAASSPDRLVQAGRDRPEQRVLAPGVEKVAPGAAAVGEASRHADAFEDAAVAQEIGDPERRDREALVARLAVEHGIDARLGCDREQR